MTPTRKSRFVQNRVQVQGSSYLSRKYGNKPLHPLSPKIMSLRNQAKASITID